MFVLKFKIRLGIRNSGYEKKIWNYSRMPDYCEMAIPIRSATSTIYARKAEFFLKNTALGWQHDIRFERHGNRTL